ncbi:23S rRNA (uracil(1939)-C(5))-methyltransferase RlmD [Cerasibacillus terrae]|uniref:23S rRNA (Uracil(1939)-C(5))-methyltransferase RlmD n=1 Tax=Cerasibacillus terrae TaxID=2498845 RepID=A0A5C8NXK6_9BACI|nr:23S rRNA (uracil(1939)-C(5))-methyltransferase RlmD [Cerasibacillus terrae]TXL65693.1 23S rRNA (uracil(1939)-C(5))-methyltransferase RlmD [Cerasibacillus terrae]
MAYRYNENTFVVDIDHLDVRGTGQAVIEWENKHGKIKKNKINIPYTLPGEKVQATLVPPYRRRVAQVDHIIKAHPERIEPECPHFQSCGGCSWQHWTYEAQLRQKTNQVKFLLEEQGFDTSLVEETIGADDEWHYRNKMEFTFGIDGTLGLHEKDNFRKIISLETCLLASDAMIAATLEVADWAREHQLAGYNKETHEGLLRHLMVRYSRTTGEMILALFATEAPDAVKASHDLIYRIGKKFPQVKSFMWLKNNNISDRAQAEESYNLLGRDFIYDELAGFRYRIWFDTFFQTNPKQAEKLVELALEMAKPKQTEKMIDLFCGVGTFSLPFARRVRELVGIEIVETSIESAKRNASDNGVNNTHFLAKDARHGLIEMIEKFGSPNLLLLDPPRSGAGGKVMRRIARSKPERIVYVSCNPLSLATDIKELIPFGYTLEKVQPVDLFPQTYHVECVALLSKE